MPTPATRSPTRKSASADIGEAAGRPTIESTGSWAAPRKRSSAAPHPPTQNNNDNHPWPSPREIRPPPPPPAGTLLPETRSGEDLGRVARKLLGAFALPFTPQGNELFISASVGIALFPNDGDDADELIRQADAAMFLAKRSGRDDFRFCSKELTASAHHLELVKAMISIARCLGQQVVAEGSRTPPGRCCWSLTAAGWRRATTSAGRWGGRRFWNSPSASKPCRNTR
ncbi:diguanylate cyclase domain-containing protein [Endothiovibrio diazotrophicus]